MGACCVIVLGLFGEKIFRRRSVWIIVACFVYLATHLSLYLLSCAEACYIAILPVILLGLSFSLFSTVIIPALPFVVDMHMIGTGFGLMAVA